jgi:hypothetical protein
LSSSNLQKAVRLWADLGVTFFETQGKECQVGAQGYTDHTRASCLAAEGAFYIFFKKVFYLVGTVSRHLVRDVLSANLALQVHENSLLSRQLLSICHDHRVNWEGDFCEHERKRQGWLEKKQARSGSWGN